MTRLKEVKGIVSADGFFKRTRVTVRVTSDMKGQSLSLTDEKQGIMIHVPLEPLKDMLEVVDGE